MIEKRYVDGDRRCDVTFTLDAARATVSVSVVGDFNNWDPRVHPMTRENGAWTATVRLDAGKEYLFRYLVDESLWENDELADRHVPSPYGDSQNSAISV